MAAARPDRKALLTRAGAHSFLVLDDEPEMAAPIRRLRPPLLERHELVAEVDERHRRAPAAELERPEQPLPEVQRLVEVPDLQRHVVDPDGARHGVSLGER